MQFHDSTTRGHIEEPLLELRELWNTHLLDRSLGGINASAPQTDSEVFQQFVKGDVKATGIYTTLDRLFYWEPGTYEVRLRIETDRPRKAFDHRFSFTLTADDAKILRYNVIGAMDAATHDPNYVWKWAHCDYEKFRRVNE